MSDSQTTVDAILPFLRNFGTLFAFRRLARWHLDWIRHILACWSIHLGRPCEDCSFQMAIVLALSCLIWWGNSHRIETPGKTQVQSPPLFQIYASHFHSQTRIKAYEPWWSCMNQAQEAWWHWNKAVCSLAIDWCKVPHLSSLVLGSHPPALSEWQDASLTFACRIKDSLLTDWVHLRTRLA